jgi:hypothetical protein
MLKMSAEQQKDLDELENEVDEKLDKILTLGQRQRLKERNGLASGGLAGLAPPGQIMSLSMQISLRPSDKQRKELSGLQKKADETLEEILTADQKTQFKKMKEDFHRGRPPGLGTSGPPGAGPGRPVGPSGRRPVAPPGIGDFGAPPGMNPVFRAHRYGADYAGLAGKDLTPGKSIEELQAKELEKSRAQ